MSSVSRVLHVVPGYNGGISAFVLNLIQGFHENEVFCDVACFVAPPESYALALSQAGSRHVVLPNWKTHPLLFVRSFRKIIKEGNYCVVHCHFSGLRSLIIKAVAKCAGVRYCFTHSHRSNDEKRLNRISLFMERLFSRLLSDKYFACSDIACEHVFGANALTSTKYVFFPNGISFASYSKESRGSSSGSRNLRAILDVRDDVLLIAHIGRFAPQKNHSFCISVAKEIASQDDRDFRLVLIGDGPERDNVETLISDYRLQDKVVLLGNCDDVPDLLHQFDCMILPSLYEGLPTVVIEAQAAGIMSVVSNLITRQCDLGLGLVRFLPLDDLPMWAESCRMPYECPADNTRCDVFKEYGFTQESMAAKYSQIITEMIR